MKKLLLLLICFFTLISSASFAYKQPWSVWVGELKQEAVSQGIRANLFDAIFRNMRPAKRVLHYDRTQPEHRLTFLKYRNTRVTAYRIRLGRSEYKKHRHLIDRIARQYGVSSCYIVTFWGLESSYGRYMGNFPVIQSLATLAYDGRRSAFFRKELLFALRIVNDGHINYHNLKGEWAGASGQSQFLPSSWFNYAVDYDGDGRKDIWKTYGDIFASIANYLVKNGWQSGQPWGVQVRLPVDFDKNLSKRKAVMSVEQWRRLGVQITPRDGQSHPSGHLKGRIVMPFGGPNYLVFNNFNVIMKWNRSIFYGGAVGYMANQICRR